MTNLGISQIQPAKDERKIANNISEGNKKRIKCGIQPYTSYQAKFSRYKVTKPQMQRMQHRQSLFRHMTHILNMNARIIINSTFEFPVTLKASDRWTR